MIINYIEASNYYGKKINGAAAKEQAALTQKINKLREWAYESVRKYKEGV